MYIYETMSVDSPTWFKCDKAWIGLRGKAAHNFNALATHFVDNKGYYYTDGIIRLAEALNFCKINEYDYELSIENPAKAVSVTDERIRKTEEIRLRLKSIRPNLSIVEKKAAPVDPDFYYLVIDMAKLLLNE